MAKEVISGATPLAAVSAIAFDTETTGLDPANDRIIEMGAIAIRRSAVVASDTFSSFVKPGIPVLYMSGYTNDIISHRGVIADGIWFLQKPFSPNDLTRKVRELLDR